MRWHGKEAPRRFLTLISGGIAMPKPIPDRRSPSVIAAIVINARVKLWEALAADLIEARWPLVEKVAAALIERRTLTEDEVTALILPPAPPRRSGAADLVREEAIERAGAGEHIRGHDKSSSQVSGISEHKGNDIGRRVLGSDHAAEAPSLILMMVWRLVLKARDSADTPAPSFRRCATSLR
jgi:hypothetical protein